MPYQYRQAIALLIAFLMGPSSCVSMGWASPDLQEKLAPRSYFEAPEHPAAATISETAKPVLVCVTMTGDEPVAAHEQEQIKGAIEQGTVHSYPWDPRFMGDLVTLSLIPNTLEHTQRARALRQNILETSATVRGQGDSMATEMYGQRLPELVKLVLERTSDPKQKAVLEGLFRAGEGVVRTAMPIDGKNLSGKRVKIQLNIVQMDTEGFSRGDTHRARNGMPVRVAITSPDDGTIQIYLTSGFFNQRSPYAFTQALMEPLLEIFCGMTHWESFTQIGLYNFLEPGQRPVQVGQPIPLGNLAERDVDVAVRERWPGMVRLLRPFEAALETPAEDPGVMAALRRYAVQIQDLVVEKVLSTPESGMEIKRLAQILVENRDMGLVRRLAGNSKKGQVQEAAQEALRILEDRVGMLHAGDFLGREQLRKWVMRYIEGLSQVNERGYGPPEYIVRIRTHAQDWEYRTKLSLTLSSADVGTMKVERIPAFPKRMEKLAVTLGVGPQGQIRKEDMGRLITYLFSRVGDVSAAPLVVTPSDFLATGRTRVSMDDPSHRYILDQVMERLSARDRDERIRQEGGEDASRIPMQPQEESRDSAEKSPTGPIEIGRIFSEQEIFAEEDLNIAEQAVAQARREIPSSVVQPHAVGKVLEGDREVLPVLMQVMDKVREGAEMFRDRHPQLYDKVMRCLAGERQGELQLWLDLVDPPGRTGDFGGPFPVVSYPGTWKAYAEGREMASSCHVAIPIRVLRQIAGLDPPKAGITLEVLAQAVMEVLLNRLEPAHPLNALELSRFAGKLKGASAPYLPEGVPGVCELERFRMERMVAGPYEGMIMHRLKPLALDPEWENIGRGQGQGAWIAYARQMHEDEKRYLLSVWDPKSEAEKKAAVLILYSLRDRDLLERIQQEPSLAASLREAAGQASALIENKGHVLAFEERTGAQNKAVDFVTEALNVVHRLSIGSASSTPQMRAFYERIWKNSRRFPWQCEVRDDMRKKFSMARRGEYFYFRFDRPVEGWKFRKEDMLRALLYAYDFDPDVQTEGWRWSSGVVAPHDSIVALETQNAGHRQRVRETLRAFNEVYPLGIYNPFVRLEVVVSNRPVDEDPDFEDECIAFLHAFDIMDSRDRIRWLDIIRHRPGLHDAIRKSARGQEIVQLWQEATGEPLEIPVADTTQLPTPLEEWQTALDRRYAVQYDALPVDILKWVPSPLAGLLEGVPLRIIKGVYRTSLTRTTGKGPAAILMSEGLWNLIGHDRPLMALALTETFGSDADKRNLRGYYEYRDRDIYLRLLSAFDRVARLHVHRMELESSKAQWETKVQEWRAEDQGHGITETTDSVRRGLNEIAILETTIRSTRLHEEAIARDVWTLKRRFDERAARDIKELIPGVVGRLTPAEMGAKDKTAVFNQALDELMLKRGLTHCEPEMRKDLESAWEAQMELRRSLETLKKGLFVDLRIILDGMQQTPQAELEKFMNLLHEGLAQLPTFFYTAMGENEVRRTFPRLFERWPRLAARLLVEVRDAEGLAFYLRRVPAATDRKRILIVGQDMLAQNAPLPGAGTLGMGKPPWKQIELIFRVESAMYWGVEEEDAGRVFVGMLTLGRAPQKELLRPVELWYRQQWGSEAAENGLRYLIELSIGSEESRVRSRAYELLQWFLTHEPWRKGLADIFGQQCHQWLDEDIVPSASYLMRVGGLIARTMGQQLARPAGSHEDAQRAQRQVESQL